jgi:thiol-disulfide isomerase/thioredoxin
MINKKNIIFYLIVISFSATAQTINLKFPYFEGQTYFFKIFQGENHITLKEDTIPNGGDVQLVIPKEYQGYKGMAQWYLTNSKTGGGLDLIINNEDFSVTCLDSVPSSKSIIYSGSIEYTFDKTNYQLQNELFDQHDAMLAAVRAYPKNNKLFPVFEKELKKIAESYATYSKKLAESPLYAARFRQIVNLTLGIGTIITEDETTKANNINDLIVNQLDFEALYTSNHWGGVINSWLQMQSLVLKNDRQLVQDVKTILNRLPSDTIYTDFVVKITKELSKVGKDYILDALTQEIKSSKRLLRYDGVLNLYQQDLSGKAPDLTFITYTGKKVESNKIVTDLKTSELNSKYTLLVFYKSGCGPCEETMQGLMDNYKEMANKEYRIITVAADTDEQIFKNTSILYPWADKYCDFEGATGMNFKNYAVIGTPTMYVIDSVGNIESKLDTLNDVLTFVKQH